MITLYGIKNCDTVKKAQKFLQAQNTAYNFHDFREQGLSAEKVEQWLDAVGVEVLVNKRSTTWKQLTDDERNNLNRQTAVALCVANPTLIKRPVLEQDGRVTVGFTEATYQQFAP